MHKAPAELETIGNRLQTFHCLHLTSWFPNHPDSSPRKKKRKPYTSKLCLLKDQFSEKKNWKLHKKIIPKDWQYFSKHLSSCLAIYACYGCTLKRARVVIRVTAASYWFETILHSISPSLYFFYPDWLFRLLNSLDSWIPDFFLTEIYFVNGFAWPLPRQINSWLFDFVSLFLPLFPKLLPHR